MTESASLRPSITRMLSVWSVVYMLVFSRRSVTMAPRRTDVTHSVRPALLSTSFVGEKLSMASFPSKERIFQGVDDGNVAVQD